MSVRDLMWHGRALRTIGCENSDIDFQIVDGEKCVFSVSPRGWATGSVIDLAPVFIRCRLSRGGTTVLPGEM